MDTDAKQPMVTLARFQESQQRYETLCKMYQTLAESLPVWLMLVLCPKDNPSSGGIYKPIIIANKWVSFLKRWPVWEQVIYLEEFEDEVTGEFVTRLWRKQDWDEGEPQRLIKEKARKKSQRDIWETRYRVYRTLRQLRQQGRMSKSTALETVQAMLDVIKAVPSMASMLDALTTVPFSAPIDEEDYEDFRAEWRYKSNHVYEELWDLTGNE